MGSSRWAGYANIGRDGKLSGHLCPWFLEDRVHRKEELRKKRHRRVRKKVLGTPERPRLNVYRSLNNIYAQIVDDTKAHTIAAASTIDREIRGQLKTGGNVESAKSVGLLVGKRAMEAGIREVVFDRGGYQYHGRVKAVAEGAREAGLRF